MSRLVLVAALALAAVSTACSSGALGDNGAVRFSFVGSYANSADASTPVATHTTLRVLLQHPQSAGVTADGATFVQLSLTAKALSGGSEPSVFPTGFAEYGVYFDKAGSYQLTAKQGDKELDHLTLTVKDPDALVFDPSVSVITNTSGTNGCSDSATVPLAQLDLAENQSARLVVVPELKGAPMMGLPALVADGPNASFATVASSYALTPLTLWVTPTQPGSDIALTATDLGNNLTAKATLKTHSGQADVTCH